MQEEKNTHYRAVGINAVYKLSLYFLSNADQLLLCVSVDSPMRSCSDVIVPFTLFGLIEVLIVLSWVVQFSCIHDLCSATMVNNFLTKEADPEACTRFDWST